MTFEQAIKDLKKLPDELRQEAIDYISFLNKKYQNTKTAFPIQKLDLSNDPFVGIWKDRSELKDSTAWIRQIRREKGETP